MDVSFTLFKSKWISLYFISIIYSFTTLWETEAQGIQQLAGSPIAGWLINGRWKIRI